MAARTHHHLAATGAITVLYAIDAVDDARSGEVWRGNDLHQLVDGGFGVAQHVKATIHHLVDVVRRNIGGHADGNTCRAIDQQIGQFAGQYQRLFLAAVVVGAEIDGFLVDIAQHFVRDFRQANFGISHGCSAVTIHRSEVALAIYQHVAQREILGHANDGVIHRKVAVRVVFTNHVAHDTGRLFVGSIPVVVELVHGKEHAPVYGFEAIPCIGQSSPHDNAHCVVEITAPHFLFEADRQGFFGKLGHWEAAVTAKESHFRGKSV